MRTLMLVLTLCFAIPATASAQSLARGKYIVERTSMCHDCHTPRDETGKLLMDKSLQGAPIGSKPIHPMPWADYAPPIDGIPPHFTPQQMVTFLQTGKRPDGSLPLPPMPPYRFSPEDAQSVMEYLRAMKH